MRCLLPLLLIALPIALLCSPTEGSEEQLFVRRIVEFWRDQDDRLADQQIDQFLATYPASGWRDPLLAMQCQIAARSGDHLKTLSAFAQIADPAVAEPLHPYRLHALFKLGKYSELIREPIERGDASRFYCAQAHHRLGGRDHLIEAERLLGEISDPTYCRSARLLRAKLLSQLEAYGAAAALYFDLAQEEGSDEYRYFAGLCQMQSDSDGALKTMRLLSANENPWRAAAAYNTLLLLHRRKEYQELLELLPQFTSIVEADRAPMVDYIAGDAHYQLGQYESALSLLLALAPDHPQKSRALLSAMDSARRLEEGKKVEECYAQWMAAYRGSEEESSAHLLRALWLKESGRLAEALDELVFAETTSSPESDLISYEKVKTLFALRRYEDAHREAMSGVDRFASSPYAANRLRLLLRSSLQLTKSEPIDRLSYERLVHTACKLLDQPHLFLEEELQNYRLIAGRALYQCQEYKRAIDLLSSYLAGSKDSEADEAMAHLLLCSCLACEQGDSEEIIAHGELALEMAPELAGAQAVRIELYNRHLQANRPERAADHLYGFFCRTSTTELQIDNLLWLANHYSASRPERAAAILERLVYGEDGKMALLRSGRLLDGELLALARLQQGEERRIALLEEGVAQLQCHPEWPWRHKEELAMELGRSYEAQGETAKAEEVYKRIVDQISGRDNRWRQEGELRLALLHDGEDLTADLSTLKDLQIRKRISSEPIHLEAALLYVAAQSDGTPPPEQGARKLFLLKRVRDDFCNEESVLAREYHSCRQEVPVQDAIYRAYLHWIEGEIALLEGREADGWAEREQACQLFSLILLDSPPLGDLMERRMRQGGAR